MNGRCDWRGKQIARFQKLLAILEYIPRHYEIGCGWMKRLMPAVGRAGWRPKRERNWSHCGGRYGIFAVPTRY
jgi:hypothetical protein